MTKPFATIEVITNLDDWKSAVFGEALPLINDTYAEHIDQDIRQAISCVISDLQDGLMSHVLVREAPHERNSVEAQMLASELDTYSIRYPLAGCLGMLSDDLDVWIAETMQYRFSVLRLRRSMVEALTNGYDEHTVATLSMLQIADVEDLS